MTRSRFRVPPFAARLLLAAASMAVVVVGFEVGVRHLEPHVVQQHATGVVGTFQLSPPQALVYYTHNGKRLRPNSRVTIKNHRLSKRDISIATNSFGFRDTELPEVKGESEVRILVLGDSITFADYLPDEAAYVERAEHYLQGAIEGRHVEVINAGIGDVGLETEIDILEESGVFIEPDVVVVAFYLNDSRPPWGFPEEIRGRGWLRRHSVLATKIYEQFLLRKWIEAQGENRFAWTRTSSRLDWRRNREAFLQLAFDARYDWGAAWQPSSWTVIDEEIERLQRLSLEWGFKVAVVIFPVSFQAQAAFLEDTPQRIMKSKASALGWPVLDVLPMARKDPQHFFYDQCHPRVEANDRIGRALAELLKAGLLAEQQPREAGKETP
jgi:lysophospholipase L1-like esterase